MKKTYISPVSEIVMTTASDNICQIQVGSVQGGELQYGGNADELPDFEPM